MCRSVTKVLKVDRLWFIIKKKRKEFEFFIMCASSKFGEFSDSQLVDWMRCNPGGAAKAFEFWRRSHPEGGNVEFREKVVYKDKVVYQDREVEKVVYKDREVRKEVTNPLNKIAFAVAGCSLVVAGLIGSFSGTAEVITKEVPGPERVVTNTVEVIPSDYNQLKYLVNNPPNPTQTDAYLSLKSENRALYGILCNVTGNNDYCSKN